MEPSEPIVAFAWDNEENGEPLEPFGVGEAEEQSKKNSRLEEKGKMRKRKRKHLAKIIMGNQS